MAQFNLSIGISVLIMAASCSNLKLKQLDFSLHFALKNRDTLIEQSVIPMEVKSCHKKVVNWNDSVYILHIKLHLELLIVKCC